MHIVIISRSYPNRINQSSGNFVLNQVEALAKHDIKIGVVGVYNVSLKEAKQTGNIKKYGFYKKTNNNVTNYSHLHPVIPKLHYLNHRIKFRIWKKLLKKYIEENGKPDLIHLHTFEAGEVAIWAKDTFGINYIVTEHTSLFYTNLALQWHKELASIVYSKSTVNLAVSQASADDLKTRFNQEFNYFPNFVNTTRFQLKEKKNRNYTQFINIAFLDTKKNQGLLIDAFNMAFDNDENYKLKIIGNGPEMANLKSLVKNLGNTNIEFLGYLPQEQIVKELQISNYFVLSSNYETFGVVLIEAMSCGLPVVSTMCGGPESIIINDKLGFLCEKDNVSALSETLVKLTQSDFDSKYIRDYAIQNFSGETLSRKLIDIYKSIIN